MCEHKFLTVYHDAEEDNVVQWCQDCGAIRIDKVIKREGNDYPILQIEGIMCTMIPKNSSK